MSEPIKAPDGWRWLEVGESRQVGDWFLTRYPEFCLHGKYWIADASQLPCSIPAGPWGTIRRVDPTAPANPNEVQS